MTITEQFKKIRENVKFQKNDQLYLSRRQEFANNIGSPNLFKYIDQFGLYAGEQTLASHLISYEWLKLTIDVPGHIIEFGTWHGRNLLLMAKLLRLMQPSTSKLVFGFDNFQGLPMPVLEDGDYAKETIGKYKGEEQILKEAIKLYELEDWVHLVIGDANETIPMFEQEFQETLVSLAWIDFDLYLPCKTALNFLLKRLSPGGIIVFDEAVSMNWPGETTALLEFIEESGSKFRMQANTLGRQPVLTLIKES